MSDTTSKDEAGKIIVDLIRATAANYNSGKSGIDLDPYIQRIKQYGIEERIDELKNLIEIGTRTAYKTVRDNKGGIYTEDVQEYISNYEAKESLARLEARNNRGKTK